MEIIIAFSLPNSCILLGTIVNLFLCYLEISVVYGGAVRFPVDKGWNVKY